MPSAIRFNLDQSKILSFGYGLISKMMTVKAEMVLIFKGIFGGKLHASDIVKPMSDLMTRDLHQNCPQKVKESFIIYLAVNSWNFPV